METFRNRVKNINASYSRVISKRSAIHLRKLFHKLLMKEQNIEKMKTFLVSNQHVDIVKAFDTLNRCSENKQEKINVDAF